MATKRSSVKTADSSGRAAKSSPRQRKPKKSPSEKTRTRKLPAPVEPGLPERQPEPASSPGLLSGLGNLFGEKPSAEAPSASQKPSQGSLADSGTSSAGELPEEAEERLDAIPDVVGEPADGAESGESGSAIAEMMEQVAFEEDDVREAIELLFDGVAEKFHSDHWKMSPLQLKLYARPTTQLANALWEELKKLMPGMVGQWAETMPGLLGFLTLSIAFVGPKVATQVKLSRKRGDEPSHMPKQVNVPHGKVTQSKDGVAEATGIIGGA